MLCLLCALLSAAIASGVDANTLTRDLENRYRGARTLKALFFERYSDGKGGIVAESGTVYFSRPGRMRWEYNSPQEKLFLVDGTNVWFYIPADRTVSRTKMKQSSDWRTPLALLVGKADLSEICRRIDLVGKGGSGDLGERPLSPGNALLRCTLRDNRTGAEGNAAYVLLEADSEARLVRVVIREAGNAETEFRFGNWQENLPIAKAKFHFQPPPGVAVVDEESLANELH
jgi:outer membrane lipoprotein carrier protein